MNFSPVRNCKRGRPRRVVHIGFLAHDPVAGWSFSNLDSDLFPGDVCFVHPVDGSFDRVGLASSAVMDPCSVFSLSFVGSFRSIDGRTYYDVARLTYLGRLKGSSNYAVVYR